MSHTYPDNLEDWRADDENEAALAHSEAPLQLSDEGGGEEFHICNASGPRSCHPWGTEGERQDSFIFWVTF